MPSLRLMWQQMQQCDVVQAEQCGCVGYKQRRRAQQQRRLANTVAAAAAAAATGVGQLSRSSAIRDTSYLGSGRAS